MLTEELEKEESNRTKESSIIYKSVCVREVDNLMLGIWYLALLNLNCLNKMSSNQAYREGLAFLI